MSHVVTIKTELNDIAAVKAAVKDLGLVWKEGQKEYKWFGTHVGDYPLPTGFKNTDLGKCDHAIGVPGTNWEIGVARKRNADGSLAPGYTLLCDFYGHEGRPIAEALGAVYHRAGSVVWDGKEGRPYHVRDLSFNRFTQAYAVARATAAAKAKGYIVTRKAKADGTVQLVVTGM